jgi:plastocyanin
MYQFWVFVHIAGVFGFLAAHGTSIAITFRLRKERDPRKVNDLIAFSGSTIRMFYISLVVLLVGGIVAGFEGHWWSQGWIWAALVVLVLTSIGMISMARPYYRRAAFVARAMAGGSQAVTDEQFDEILRSGRSHAITTIGVVGLGLILYLMVYKPTLGFGGGGSAAPPPPSSGSSGQCAPSGTTLSISAQNISFDTKCLAAPANTAFTIDFTDKEGVPHNVAIYTNSSASHALFRGQTQSSPGTVTYQVGALPAGTYFFRCDVHPTQMTGVFIVG